MGKNIKKILLKQDFYVKENDIVLKVTKQEYKDFIANIEKSGGKYICPECRICTCEKIRYYDINCCEGVKSATLSKKYYKLIRKPDAEITKEEIQELENSRYVDKVFHVYQCDKFEKFKELTASYQKKVIRKVIDLDMEILTLKDEIKGIGNNNKFQVLSELINLRNSKIEDITDEEFKSRLIEEERKLKEKFEKNKILKL